MGLFTRKPEVASALTAMPDVEVPAAPADALALEVASWPTGVVRFDGATLEFGAGDLRRVPVSSLGLLELRPKAGRLQLRISYRAGLDRVKTGMWVQTTHEADLRALVASVNLASASAHEEADHALA